MAASANYHLSPVADDYYYYNHGLTSSYSYLHHQIPMFLPILGYRQEENLVCSQIWVPLYPLYQPQPSDFEPSYNHNNHTTSFLGRAESSGYPQFTACDGSWVVDSQDQPDGFSSWASDECDSSWVVDAGEEEPQPNMCHYNRDFTNHPGSFLGSPENGSYQLMAREESWILDAGEEEEIRHWLEDHVVVYDSTDVEDEGLCEETISKKLKVRDENGEGDGQMCVVCQEWLLQEGDEKIGGLDCGHDFHEGCIKNWLMIKNSCPLCKTTAICL